MAKKTNKISSPTKKIDEDKVSKEEVIKQASLLGYSGTGTLSDIQDWIRKKYSIHAEIFYSMFHKKFSINNYFIDLSKGKKIEWDYKSTLYDSYDDALIIVIYNILILIK